MRNQFPVDTFFFAWGVHSLNLSQTFQFSLYKCKSGYFKCMHHTERMVELMLSSSRSTAENIFCFISCLQAVISQCSVRVLLGAKICRVQARTECKIRLWTGTSGLTAGVWKMVAKLHLLLPTYHLLMSLGVFSFSLLLQHVGLIKV